MISVKQNQWLMYGMSRNTQQSTLLQLPDNTSTLTDQSYTTVQTINGDV